MLLNCLFNFSFLGKWVALRKYIGWAGTWYEKNIMIMHIVGGWEALGGFKHLLVFGED